MAATCSVSRSYVCALIQAQVPSTPASSPRLLWTAFFDNRGHPAWGTIYHGAQQAWGLTCALRVTACPGAIHRAMSAEQAGGVVAFPTLVDNGAGENQAITEQNSGVAWSPGVATRDY